jgi:formamidopyrimidine-DNA glycosylase
LENKRVPIKVALLDQKIINGIGNIYASEALFRAKILPTRESGSLSEKECCDLLDAVRETLTLAINAVGSTLRDYHKTDGSLGYFQNMHCVYNKTGQRCPNCTCNSQKTGGIKKIIQAGRSTFFCPEKQK